MPLEPHQETPSEIASAMVSGVRPWAEDAPHGRPPGAALDAFEAAVLPALRRTPCLVTFSGGVDSSLVLAVATRVARRHGLADPLPVTWRFPWAPATDETDVQHRVVKALQLREWLVLTADEGELDFVGPVARDVLRLHGVRHPANLHLHARPMALAAGGSVITGAGGDQILSGWRRPENVGPVRQAKDRVPPGWRVRLRRLPGRELPWMHPGAAAAVLRARLEEEAAEPVLLADRVRWHAGRRDLRLSLDNLARLGAPHDVAVVNPLVDANFVHALAGELGSRPAPRRSALVTVLGRGLLPPVVAEPRRKARFGEVFLAGPSRALAQGWDGGGIDPRFVDVAGLRRAWSTWPVPLGTAGLLQQVLLSAETRSTVSPVAA